MQWSSRTAMVGDAGNRGKWIRIFRKLLQVTKEQPIEEN